MKDLTSLIAYFKACYQSDNRERRVPDFFDKKIENQLILHSAELLQGQTDKIPVNVEWAADFQQNMKLYAKEKELICCSFFLVGYIKNGGKRKKICTPLYIHLAKSGKEQESYFVELADNYSYINPAVVELLQPKDENLNVYEHLSNELSSGYLGIKEIDQMELMFERTFSNVSTDYLSRYPFVMIEEELNEVYKKAAERGLFELIPATGLAVIKKSALSRGVLNELESLSKKTSFPDSLNTFFTEKEKVSSNAKKRTHYVPANLSGPQLNILDAIDIHTHNVVIGPPGTGKSFTIAAIAVDAISTGKSVLIASKTDQAVDVIANKLEDDFNLKNVIVRGGRRGYMRELKKRIDNLLSGIGFDRSDSQSLHEIQKLEKGIEKLADAVDEVEKEIAKREPRELKWGPFLSKKITGLFNNFKRKWIEYNIIRWDKHWELVETLGKSIDQRNQLVQKYVLSKFNLQLYRAFKNNRKEFQALRDALKARTGNKKSSIFSKINFDYLLKALPIWLVNSSEISKILPLQKGMFDLLIIDEATQCDMASSLPLIYRAKKIIVVGDPQQLRHVSFLSGKKQEELRDKMGLTHLGEEILDYRNRSLLDMLSDKIDNQSQIHFLDEHYRSLPQIIHFSNERFYSNSLKVMTEAPFSDVSNSIVSIKTKGKRTKTGYNKEESEAVLARMRRIVDEEATLSENYCQSLGVISPFRAQVEYLQRKLPEYFNLEEMDRHKMLLGTPYSFQGEERDVIFLSFAVDDDTHPSALHYLNREDVFNVAVTRARVKQVVVSSIQSASLGANNLLGKYLSYIQQSAEQQENAQQVEYEDAFSKDVVAFLAQKGVTNILHHHSLAGFELDLVVMHQEKTWAIDFIGYPGRFAHAFPIEKCKMLKRVGIEVLVLPYTQWVLDRESVEAKLVEVMGENV